MNVSSQGFKSLFFKNNKNIDLILRNLINSIKYSIISGRSISFRLVDLLDNILFMLLYKRENLLLKSYNKRDKYNVGEITELTNILNKYSDYRNLIGREVIKIDKNFNKDILISKLYPGVNRLVLLITHSCQLKCQYCRVRKFNAWMNKKVLLKAIKFLFTSYKNDLYLQFFGGEPLLNFNLIKTGVNYAESLAKQYKKNLTFILTTNGVLLTRDKINYFRRHNFIVEFSCDGMHEIQFKARKPKDNINYYPVILDNLRYLISSNIPHYTISVVTPQNVSKMNANFRYLVSLGLKRLQINYCLGVIWREKEIRELMSQIQKILDFIKNTPLTIDLINLSSQRREPVVLNAELTVDCNGDIYYESGICLEEDFLKMKKRFFIADINNVQNINLYSRTQFDNFYLLSKIYGESNKRFRKIILNNIYLGSLLNRWINKRFI